MKLRNIIRLLGGINTASAQRSTIAAVLHGLDVKSGKRGAHGKRFTKRPHRGIACPVPGGVANYARHIKGERDKYRSWRHSRVQSSPFRDSQPMPVLYTE